MKMDEKISGLLLINKPKGITSFQVIRILRRATGIDKMGHAGTLDQNACGLLLLGIGQGTKALSYAIKLDKTYLFRMMFGIESETLDWTGFHWRYQSVDFHQVTEENIRTILSEHFMGEIQQKPPIYSSLKRNGRRMSDYAREGKEVEPPSRPIRIHDIELLHLHFDSYTPQAIFRMHCSHGTYVRSFCRDMAVKLGTIGSMTHLCRIQIGPFFIHNACPLDAINSREDLIGHLLPAERVTEIR